jgi:hypothetical protein
LTVAVADERCEWDSEETTGPVLMAAIREVLDRTNYQEWHAPTFDDLRPHMDRLLAEIEADMTPEELAESRERRKRA